MHGFWIPSVLLAKLSSCRASKNALSYSTDFINFILIQIYVLFNVSKRSWCHLHSHITPRTRAGESLCTGGRRLDEVYHYSIEMVEVDSSRCQGLLSLRGPDLVWRKSELQNRSHRCCTRGCCVFWKSSAFPSVHLRDCRMQGWGAQQMVPTRWTAANEPESAEHFLFVVKYANNETLHNNT